MPSFNRTYPSLFNEEQLLQRICQLSLNQNPVVKKHIYSLLTKKRINWVKLIHLIQSNKLQIIFYKTTVKHGLFKHIPQTIQDRIIKLNLIATHNHSRHLQQSLLVLKEFNKHKVNFVVMKTYALFHKKSSNSPIKHVFDIDLLIPLKDFKQAVLTLLKLKYKHYHHHYLKQDTINTSAFPLDFYSPKSQELFIKDGHLIELHNTIVDTFHFFTYPIINHNQNLEITQELFDHAHTTNFKEVKIKTFPPNQLILSLFLHSFFQHNLQSGISACEFANLTNKYQKQLDWNYLIDFTNRRNLLPFFLWYLHLIDKFLPNYLPQKALSLIRQYRKEFKLQQHFLTLFMEYKILHPTNFLKGGKEVEKEICWAIINSRLIKLFIKKLLNLRLF